ncbi:hypothetical protein M413DRAFT_379055 [Hebeloma cylindrosporum]|uniref:Uncharacterized protein n=1 Tax=Hebeloma cylindrosporum TaxID=76867 RepID=A0A0C2YTH9_HEBCY|nr:hypothetical protein M413DRAFT_379055 [Hebeloma cylindrosporum h7]
MRLHSIQQPEEYVALTHESCNISVYENISRVSSRVQRFSGDTIFFRRICR